MLESYDEYTKNQKEYEEELKKLDNIKDYSTWKNKSKRLIKKHILDQTKLKYNSDVEELSGDINANFLYHYTTCESAYDIIEDNEFIGTMNNISFTTHPNLYKRGFTFWHGNEYTKRKDHTNLSVKIKLDFNKIKKDGLEFELGSAQTGTVAGEKEIIIIDPINDVLKYLIEIIIIKDKEDNKNDLISLVNLLKSKNIKYHLI
jgi:hypothetical protein